MHEYTWPFYLHRDYQSYLKNQCIPVIDKKKRSI